jgi:hypothetical protein
MSNCHLKKVLSIQDSISLQIIAGIILIGCLFYFQILISNFLESFLGMFSEGMNILGGGFLSGGFHALSGPDHLVCNIDHTSNFYGLFCLKLLLLSIFSSSLYT